MKSNSELQEDIQSRCERVRRALEDCPKSGLLRFYQAVGEIRTASSLSTDGDLARLDSRLDSLIQELQVTDDANGEKILGFRRWEKFM